MGDFMGFTFGEVHSDDLGIIRVSDGDRYDEQLHLEIKDIHVEVPGLNGEYYFGSNYGTRNFEISIAFDSLTEEQFREIRKVFGTQKIKDLIFDERPYKKYLAKIESPVELSYICFDESAMVKTTIDGIRYKTEDGGYSTSHIVERPTGGKRRIYKGEGKINFICYFPFAKSVYKTLPFLYQLTTDTEIQEDKKYYKREDDNYVLVSEPDVSEINTYYEKVLTKESEEWAFSSELLTDDEYQEFDKYSSETGIIKVYNAGDIETGFCLYIPVNKSTEDNLVLTYKKDGINETSKLVMLPLTLKGDDTGILIDTTNQLIYGSKNNGSDVIKTNNLYNEYIDTGYFFKFEPNNKETNSILEINTGLDENVKITYDYLYM